ncbi:hypothetical protein HNY73_001286 [Argiope bruennichi]|uniref:Uncharacterized protein n=1 Tax=Argiope bruennichi TaxID=94029 RepID=A0A8T0G1Y5_ARGBR|nr:hypothetical protein HNY73_001286 [Argiope bruennichi]
MERGQRKVNKSGKESIRAFGGQADISAKTDLSPVLQLARNPALSFSEPTDCLTLQCNSIERSKKKDVDLKNSDLGLTLKTRSSQRSKKKYVDLNTESEELGSETQTQNQINSAVKEERCGSED